MKENKKTNRSVKNYIIYDFVKITAALPTLIWYRPKIKYASESAKKHIKGGGILMSNHPTFFDPIYLMLGIWYRRHHFVAWKRIFEGSKFKEFLFMSFHCIPIDKENFGMGTFREITKHLKNDELVDIFPEGKVNRTDTGDLQTFKSGIVLMAWQSGKPIIPMYIKKRKHFYNRLVMVVGDKIDLRSKYQNTPTLKEIESETELLYEQEKILENLA